CRIGKPKGEAKKTYPPGNKRDKRSPPSLASAQLSMRRHQMTPMIAQSLHPMADVVGHASTPAARSPLVHAPSCSHRLRGLLAVGIAFAAALVPARVYAGGTLTPIGSPHQPIEIRAHQVDVVLNNGFA